MSLAEKTKADMIRLQGENESLLAEARKERDALLKEAREMRDKIVGDAKAVADEEAKKLMTRAQDEIEKQKAAAKIGDDASIWRQVEKQILLERLDHYWKEHLATLDALRQVVFLRAYAQKTPINEYKQEAFGLFERMLGAIREDVTRILMNSELRMPDPVELPELPEFLTSHIDPFTGENDAGARTPGAEAMLGALGAGVAALAAPPVLGEHTDEILHELGYSTDELISLRHDKVI